MNWDKFKKGIEDIRKVSMSESEKFSVKSNLEFYIETCGQKPIKSSWYSSFSFLYSRTYAYAFVLLLVVFSGFNAFTNTKTAVPGDKLYSLKVGVLEPFQYAITVGEVEKASLEAKNIDTRLREAEILEVQGLLTDSISSDLQNRIDLHTENFDTLVGIISTSSVAIEDTEVELDLEAKINAHSRIIDNIMSGVATNSNISKIKELIGKRKVNTLSLAKKVEPEETMTTMAFTVMETSAVPSEVDLEEEIVVPVKNEDIKKFDDKKSDTEKLIKSVRQDLERVRGVKNINKRIMLDAEASVVDAEKLLEDATSKNKSGKRSDAHKKLMDSRKKIREASISIEVSQDLPRSKRD